MNHTTERGFTLSELLVVLVLIVLLSSWAVPSFSLWIANQKQQALRDKLLYSLQNARSQAVLQGRSLEVCPLSDGDSCEGFWHKGWILKAVGTQETLSIEQLPVFDSELRWQGYRDRIIFRSNGQTPSSNGRFFLCTDQKIAWQLVISRQGRVRVTTAAENTADASRCS